MFSLLYGLWEYVFRKQELRVLIIGLDKSGKTTLLEKIKVRCLARTPLHVCFAASKGTLPCASTSQLRGQH